MLTWKHIVVIIFVHATHRNLLITMYTPTQTITPFKFNFESHRCCACAKQEFESRANFQAFTRYKYFLTSMVKKNSLMLYKFISSSPVNLYEIIALHTYMAATKEKIYKLIFALCT